MWPDPRDTFYILESFHLQECAFPSCGRVDKREKEDRYAHCSAAPVDALVQSVSKGTWVANQVNHKLEAAAFPNQCIETI